MAVTIKDVARYAGVSAMTITRSLKNPELVKQDTLERVQKAIKQLGYIPNYTASALRSAKSHTVGITVFDIENPFISKLLMQLENKLKDYNYTLLVSFANQVGVDDFDIYTKLKTFNVDLLIFVPMEQSDYIQRLDKTEAGKCLQLFRNVYDNIDSFMIDDTYGAYLATKYLLENGHKDILLIDYEQRIPLNRDLGYLKAYKDFGMEADKRFILKLNEYDDTDYVANIKNAVSTLKPTAIFAVTQKLSANCITAMGELDLKIYDDLSMVSYDDTTLAQYLGITTVTHPFDEIIEDISGWVIEKIHDLSGENRKHIKITPYLKIRNSVKNLNEK